MSAPSGVVAFVLAATLCLPSSALAQAFLDVRPGQVGPGQLVFVRVRNSESAPAGTLGGRPLSFFDVADGYGALAAIPVEHPPGLLEVRVTFPEAEDGEAPLELAGSLEVLPAHFPERELAVARRFVKPNASARRRIAADRAAFARAFSQPFTAPLFHGNFSWPLNSQVTAPFGDLRTFNRRKESQHYGTDLNGKVGDPVVAANGGRVVLARSCYASGNTVLLHHGAALYTLYFHLSKILVLPGANVRRGQLVGLLGKTGRVTGPHLHWGVKVTGLYVDPESLLAADFGDL